MVDVGGHATTSAIGRETIRGERTHDAVPAGHLDTRLALLGGLALQIGEETVPLAPGTRRLPEGRHGRELTGT